MRSLYHLLLALGLCAVMVPQSQGQALPLDVDVDYATFAYDGESSMLELYLALGAESLPYEATDGGYLASLPLDMSLRPVNAGAPDGMEADPVLQDQRSLSFAVTDTSTIQNGQYFVDLIRLAVAPGEYILDIVAAADPVRERPELRLSLDLTVPDYLVEDLTRMSDITMASVIGRAEAEDSEDPFLKNGLIVRPNPKGIYGNGQDRVFYYVEVYGLPEALGEYTLLSYISRSNIAQPLEGLQRREARPVRDPEVVVGAFNISALQSGSYFLRFALLDENNEPMAEQSKKFFVLNPDVAAPVVAMDEDFETSFYAVMGEEELEANLSHAKVIANQQEVSQIRRLDSIDAKREYLSAFWRRRDVDGDPSVNEARRQFYERLRYAEDRYDTPFQEAYETDRGRTVLKYGFPSSVDPHPYESEFLPYEVWTYDSIAGQGSALFVFADREGLGSYDMIHSTVTGEVSNPNWEQMLRR